MTAWSSVVRACGPRGRVFVCAAALVSAPLAIAILAPAAALATSVVGARLPLSESNYVVEPNCALPVPGYASCFSLKVVPVTAAARARTHPMGRSTRRAVIADSPAEGDFGLRPSDLHTGYALPKRAPVAQTIALVDAYNDPDAEGDLKTYDTEFGLPECTRASGCFKKVNQAGSESDYPENNSEWDGEISLDIEIAHAICQENCRIMLVEAEKASFEDLETAEETAVRLGATEVSNSWGIPEISSDVAAFNHPGVVVTASTGDSGYLNWLGGAGFAGHPNYPATSPHVVAVGGTRLDLNEESEWIGETVWNDGSTSGASNGAAGGGCSEHFTAPSWQQAVPDWSEVGCESDARATADVAADGDPFTGVAVYDSNGGEDWQQVGGTSLASPIIAGTFALAGGSGGVSYAAQTLYSHLSSGALHDVVSGSNGKCTKAYHPETGVSGCTTHEESQQCHEELICTAGIGYDGPSGVGTPEGIAAFTPPAPAITSISPTEGSTGGGTVVKVKGTDLLGAIAVEFGGSAGEIQSDTAGEITVKTPPHPAEGTVAVTVTTAGGTSALSPADEYDYVVPPPPTVTGVSPSSGSSVGGTTVKVTGTHLEGASVVDFDGSAAAIKSDTAGEITVKTPPHAVGKVGVTVTTTGGTSALSAADEYEYVVPPAPTVTKVQPSEGSTEGGTTVTIKGTSLEGASAVDFGEAPGSSVTVLSATELTVTSPAHAAETVHVTVTTPGGTSLTSSADQFAFSQPAPNQTPNNGGPGTSLTSSPLTSPPSVLSAESGLNPHANSNFNLLGQQVNRKKGSIELTIAVFSAGTLHWDLTFGLGCAKRHGAHKASCRSSSGRFGEGAKAISGAKIVTLSIAPGGPATKALQQGRKRGLAVLVDAHLSYTAAGGTPIAHTSSLSVRLQKAAPRRGRKG